MITATIAALAALVTLVTPFPVAGPAPEHTVVAVNREYMPTNDVVIRHGESIRFVDADPTAGPGHSFTENVPDGVTPKFDSDVVPPGLYKDVENIASLPPGKYNVHCKIHDVVKGTLTVE
jgi:hypothetical protein